MELKFIQYYQLMIEIDNNFFYYIRDMIGNWYYEENSKLNKINDEELIEFLNKKFIITETKIIHDLRDKKSL